MNIYEKLCKFVYNGLESGFWNWIHMDAHEYIWETLQICV
jgi:hypothetical protein